MAIEIKFRDLTQEDIGSLREIYSDKEAMQYRGSKPIVSIEDAQYYIRNQKLQEGNILTLRKGIELLKDKKLLGSVMYKFDIRHAKECEIGYSIGRKYWGNGYGNAIVQILLKTIRENDQVEKILAWSHRDNIASIKILEKNGFRFINQDDSSDNFLYGRINQIRPI